MSGMPRENDPVFVAELIALRSQVLDLVMKHQPISIGRLCVITGHTKHKIGHVCNRLLDYGYLVYGEPEMTCRGREAATFVIGDNTPPLPNRYRLGSRPKLLPQQQEQASYSKLERKAKEFVTQEDMAWMQYYRSRYERRYGVKVSQVFDHEHTL